MASAVNRRVRDMEISRRPLVPVSYDAVAYREPSNPALRRQARRVVGPARIVRASVGVEV